MNDRAEAPQPRRSRLRGLAAGLALLALSTAGCVLALEAAVRVFFPFFSPKTQIPFHLNADGVPLGPAGQSVRQATPKGDYDTLVHFNALGLRDPKELQGSTEADWLAIGDSFTLGWGVDEEQRFSSRLEQLLKTNGSPARVFNVAIPENIIGYGRLLKYAQAHGATSRHLIVGVCMENDLRDYSDGRGDWERAADHDWQHAVPRKELLRMWFRQHSALYTAVSFTLQRSTFFRQALEKAGIARDVTQLSGENSGDEKVLVSSRDRIKELVSGYDALVLLIPSRRLWHGATTQLETRVHERFVALLREAGIAVVDLKPAFERAGQPLDHYFATDPHWNERGHAVAARELFTAIASRKQTSAALPGPGPLLQPTALP
jgi:hypothetical protein